MKVCISFIMIGLGIGWLAGLSLSPVISTIISSLLALIASAIAFLTSVNFKKADKEQLFDNWNNSIFLMAFLMLGIVVGSSCGIYAREHNVFGLSLEGKKDIARETIEIEHEVFKVSLEKKKEIAKEVITAKQFEQQSLESDLVFYKKLLNTHLEDDQKNEKKVLLQEFIQKRILPLTSISLPSAFSSLPQSGTTLASSGIQYGRSGLYSYKENFCEFLLLQGSRVVSVIDEANRSDKNYHSLIDLLNKLRKENLNSDELTTKIQQHIEDSCP